MLYHDLALQEGALGSGELEIVDILSLYKTPNKYICSVLFEKSSALMLYWAFHDPSGSRYDPNNGCLTT